MTFLALVAALLLEQARALSPANPAHVHYHRFVTLVERSLDAGSYRQGIAAWLVATLPVVLVVWIVSRALYDVAALLGLAFDVAVLYLTMGFRQFSHDYGEVHEALRAGDGARARAAIGRWHPLAADTELGGSDIARLAIEHGLVRAHRHVFGVLAWFAVFGAAGAIFYRVAAILRERWGSRADTDGDRFGTFSREAFAVVDWVPARLTALAFAVAGDFEDALYCWRTQAAQWHEPSEGIVLAAGAGAIGVRLGSAIGRSGTVEMRPDLGTGEEPDAELMTSAVGLVWRALVLWLFVILLVTLASWFGSAAGG